MKNSNYEKVSEALYIWFTQFRENGVPISGPILKEKALQFQKEFNKGDADFTASRSCTDKVFCLKQVIEKKLEIVFRLDINEGYDVIQGRKPM